MFSRKTLASAALALIAALTLTACAGPDAAKPDASSGPSGTLTLSSVSAPSSLDPAISGNGSDLFYQQLAYAPLIMVGKTGDLEPGLATEWEYVGSGNTEFKLTLREDAKFADGTPVDAAAVAASLNYFAKNAQGPAASAFSTMTATAGDDGTVTLKSTVANPIIPDLLSTRYLAGNIISPAGLADPSALATETFGAGAYVYDPAQSVTGDHYTFTPNKNFYDQSMIHFDTVVVKVVTNPTSAVQALKSGQIDAAAGDATTAADAEAAGITVLSAPTAWIGAFNIDSDGVTVPAFKDVRVRQALNYAMDRESIAQAIYGEFGSPVHQPNVPGFDAFSDDLEGSYNFDVAKAKSLLAEAGFADGFTFRWGYPTYEAQTAKTVQAMAAQLQTVGITAELDGAANLGELVGLLTDGKHSLISLQWGGQSQFANTNQVWLPGAQINPHHVVTPGLQEAFDAYSAAGDSERGGLAQAVQKILVDQAVSVPVAKVAGINFVSADIKGAVLMSDGYVSSPLFWTK